MTQQSEDFIEEGTDSPETLGEFARGMLETISQWDNEDAMREQPDRLPRWRRLVVQMSRRRGLFTL